MWKMDEAIKQAKKYTPANPVPGEWEPTKVAEGLDILAGSRIVEQGSNENGEYWRWENGLQICCVHKVRLYFGSPLAPGSTYSFILDFPAIFSGVPSCSASGQGHTNSGSPGRDVISCRSYDGTSVTYRVMNLQDSPVSFDEVRNATIIAIGRWK